MRKTRCFVLGGLMLILALMPVGCGNAGMIGAIGDTASGTVVQARGTLRSGVYNGGNENCDTTITMGSTPPISGPTPGTISSVTVTKGGYPVLDGLELRPGAAIQEQFASVGVSIDLTVVSYQPTANGVKVVLKGQTTICGDFCYWAENGVCEEDGNFSVCQPGADCSDCQGVLPIVSFTVEETVTYIQTSPDSLKVEKNVTWNLTRATVHCYSTGARTPLPD